MDKRHLDDLIAIERGYWWHVSKRALVLDLLGRHAPSPGLAVEGGIGGGRMLLELRDRGYAVKGFDMFAEAVEHLHAHGLPDVHVHDLEKPWPVEDAGARAVLLLDVLEHLRNPVDVLADIHRILAPDGVAVLTVPAYPALLGPWDRMLGHLRRYTRSMLEDSVRAAGLQVRWMSHWNAFSLPPALVLRGVERMGRRPSGAEFPRVPPAVNRALILAAAAERRAMRVRPLPAGLSIVAVLQRAP